MKLISIGHACNIRFGINEYYSSIGEKYGQTNFFDWLTTEFSSVVQLLKCDYLKIINKDNISIYDFSEENMKVSFNLLNHCESLHDLKKNHNNDDINQFINKYRRRYCRLIDYIKNNETIYFIRYTTDSSDIKPNEFISSVLNINPNKKFKLVTLNHKYRDKSNVSENEYLIDIDMELFKKKNYDYSDGNDERHFHYDWIKLYKYLILQNNGDNI